MKLAAGASAAARSPCHFGATRLCKVTGLLELEAWASEVEEALQEISVKPLILQLWKLCPADPANLLQPPHKVQPA